MTTALIAEDEPLLAAELREALAHCWPELTVVETVHDGHAAIRELARLRPDVMFLDVQMPGVDGLEVARVAGPQAHIVFITAFDHHAVAAFDAGAVDYLLKPLDVARLGRAVERVKARLDRAPSDMSAMLARIAQARDSDRLRFITTLKGREIEFIAVDEICYFKADAKYVAVVTAKSESLITMPLRELLARLDNGVFWQVHRGTIVNINAVKSVYRTLSGNLELRLKERPEALRVGPSFTHLFQHM